MSAFDGPQGYPADSMTTVEPAIPTGLISDAQLAHLLSELAAISASLAQVAKVDASIRAFVRDLPARLHADAPGAVSADAYLGEQVFAGVARAASALLEADPKVARRTVRIALEQVRQALRDINEGRPISEDRSAAEIVGWLEQTLDASATRLAPFVNTTPRTWQRWKSAEQVPDDVAQLRLRRFAAVVGHLRFSLTSGGVLDWFERPHPVLKGGQMTPAELLDDAEGYRTVLDLAARLRTMTAT